MSRGYLFNCINNQVYLNNNRYAKHQNDCVIIRHKENLMERYGLVGLIGVAERLGISLQDDWTSTELTEAVWAKFKEITNEQIRDERRAKREARGEVPGESRGRGNRTPGPRRVRWPRTYRVCFEAIGKELRPTGRPSVPQQAATIIDRLRQQPAELFTEDEMKAFVQKLADDGVLVGRRQADGSHAPLQQTPWRIFSYYEAMLHQRGLVVRIINREYKSCE